MTPRRKSPAKKAFCVWADHVRRVYQHVTADNAQQAHDLAKKRGECWEPCDWHDNNGFRLSNEVRDLATEEFIAVCGPKNCRACRSEIVETINDSNFREGECGPCEYRRYSVQPQFADALDTLLAETVDFDLAQGIELTDRERNAREQALALFAKTNGKRI